MDLAASLQEGMFGTSLRRHTSDHGYGSLGHGAWLSTSPHPTLRGGLGGSAHRTSSAGPASMLRRQVSLGSGVLSPEQGPAVSPVAEEGLVDLERAQSAAEAGPLSPQSSTPRQQRHAQRWHLPSAEPATGLQQGADTSDLQEPLLSGEFTERPSSASAAAGKPGVEAEGAVLPAQPVAIARDVTGADRGGSDTSKALVFGAINTVATVPALVAYAAIVFKDPTYAPYIDQLCKFFFLSSALHQAVFCLLSTLPFAVGQVQDVGLIFLSAMATSIAGACAAAGRDAATALGTSLLTMSIATFFTGVMTLIVAKQKLAQLVQYLPLPVIGGYLSFVGYFCIASGIGLGTSLDIGTIMSWAQLASWGALLKLVPTVLSCLAMILTLERFSHPLALPGVLVTINLAFHAARLSLGVSLEQAMDAGWVIRPAAGPQKFWELWGLFNIGDWSLSGIHLPALGDQWIKACGLALVVIFGSAMDVAAIQQDTPKKIDFNRELMTVAVSNMATGVAGCGYTGSYIFSQTIFTMRAGVYNRLNGWVVALSEAAMFALPYPVIQYFPNFFYGSLLLWFGIEISRDWLLLSYTKMTRIEYGLLLATFGAILQWGLEGGIAAGIVAATLYFAMAYARSQVAAIDVVPAARSRVVRTVEQKAALEMLSGCLTTVHLNGIVFFGSANSIGQRLQEEAAKLGSALESVPAADRGAEEAEEAIVQSLRSMGERYTGVKHTQAVAALAAAPAYLLVDLCAVRGLDATGARTMGSVYGDVMQQGVVLVLAGADHHGMRPLLRAHGLPLPPEPLQWPLEVAQPESPGARGFRPTSPTRPAGSLAAEQAWEDGRALAAFDDNVAVACLEFATLEQALRYCEDQLLEVAVRYGLLPAPPSALLPLEEMLASHLQKLPLGPGLDPAAVADTLRRYIVPISLCAGQLLWRVDDTADELYIIEKGAVRVDEFMRVGGTFAGAAHDSSAASLDRSASGRRALSRSYEMGPGCVVGSTDFYLARPHATRAVCRSPVARVLRVTRAAMERLASEAPQALAVLQVAVMRANTLDLSQAAEQHPALC